MMPLLATVPCSHTAAVLAWLSLCIHRCNPLQIGQAYMLDRLHPLQLEPTETMTGRSALQHSVSLLKWPAHGALAQRSFRHDLPHHFSDKGFLSCCSATRGRCKSNKHPQCLPNSCSSVTCRRGAWITF